MKHPGEFFGYWILLSLLAMCVGKLAMSEVGQAVDGARSEAEVDEDAPVLLEEMERPPPTGQDQPWVAPDYSGQERALGYSPEAFATPAGMEERVQFWISIYTQYTTDQGVLHDSRYVNLVYETVDFSDLAKDESLTPGQRERARRQRVKQAKRMIEERLKRLATVKSPEELTGDDLRYYQMFNAIHEPRKFTAAAERGRLRFQLGQRDRFIEGIYQSGRYIREMEEIFRREGLPIELTRLPFVESSFNLRARSKVGASGIWQFMRSTARSYMRIDSSVDERNDPLRATVAAARKLRNNYQMLGNWPLAVTGYNHGPSGVQRLVNKFKTTNIAELTDVRRGRFGFASANFYASFLAAVNVEKSADRYFGPLKRMAELRGTELRLDRALPLQQLVQWFGGDQERAQMFNPHIRGHLWGKRLESRGSSGASSVAASPARFSAPRGSVQARTFVRLPAEIAARAIADLHAGRLKAAAASVGSDNEVREVVLEHGETLGEIAERFKVRLEALMDVNGISNPRRVRAGQKLVIPPSGN